MKKSRFSRQAASVSQCSATASVAAHPYNYVSRKFYNDLVDRIVEACGLLPDAGNLRMEAIILINSYLHKGTIDLTDCPTELALIFTILRPEIDRAMARSASARRRAASRRKMNHPENRRDDGVEEQTEESAEERMEGTTKNRRDGNAGDSTADCGEFQTSDHAEDVFHPAYALQRVPTSTQPTLTRRQRREREHALRRANRPRIKSLNPTSTPSCPS